MKPFTIRKRAGRVVIGVSLTAALAGCSGFNLGWMNPWRSAPENRDTVPAGASVYACNEGKRLIVRPLSGTSSVMIVFREREFRLDPAPAATDRYSNGSTTFVTRADEAFLEEDGAVTYANCKRAAT
jgi:membrane-bound inhibitor of C-type lysozyme